MSDVSQVENHFPTANENFVSTTSTIVDATVATEVPLTSMGTLVNNSVFVGIIEPGVAGKQQTFTGLVDTAGSQITGVKWTRGVNSSHVQGSTVVDYITGTAQNMTTKGLLIEHNQDGTHKSSLLTSLQNQILGLVYPVGSLYYNATNSSNPSSLLGFGTWVAFGAGRVPVGFSSGETEFNAAEKTGGSKTVNLSHSHTVNAHNHGAVTSSTAGDNENHTHSGVSRSVSSTDGRSNQHGHNYTRASDTQSPGTNAQLSTATTNLQPFITVYIWKRTA